MKTNCIGLLRDCRLSLSVREKAIRKRPASCLNRIDRRRHRQWRVCGRFNTKSGAWKDSE